MNEMSNKTIDMVLSKISKDILVNKDKINNNLNLGLNKILEKSEDNQDKYINILKQQVLFQMVRGRNREALLVKWISENNILPKMNRDMDLENLNKKVQLYIQNGFKSGGKSFGKNELNLLASYKNISGEDLKEKLEKDYKQLSIYNEVINKLINNIETIDIENISIEDKNELAKSINEEIKKATSFIIKSMSVTTKSIDEEKEEKIVEVEEKENSLETELIDIINNISEDDLIDKMQRAFNKSCQREDVPQAKAYKFGKNSIKEYILCVNLLDLLKEERLLINGSIRLLISGQIGEINFNELTKYIITEVININEARYDEIIKLIEEKLLNSFTGYLNMDIKIKESIDIDFEEYIYMLKNANPNEKYRKEMPEFDAQEETTVKEKYVEEIKPKKKGKVIGIVVGILLVAGLGVGGFVIVKQSKSKNDVAQSNNIVLTSNNEEQEENQVEEIEQAEPVEEIDQIEEQNEEKKSILDCGEDEYILYDSDIRFLSESELKDYTKEELKYIRNEVFARYGYIFGDNEYKEYFESKTWYHPDPDFNDDEENLNEYEKANVKLILELEKGK